MVTIGPKTSLIMPATVPIIYNIPTIIAVFLSELILLVILIPHKLLNFNVVSHSYYYISLFACPLATTEKYFPLSLRAFLLSEYEILPTASRSLWVSEFTTSYESN
jgi:hypothetical protein